MELPESRLPGNHSRDRAWSAFGNLEVEEKSLPIACYCILIHPDFVLRREAKTGSEERLRSTKFKSGAQVYGYRDKHSFRSQVEQLLPVVSPVWNQTALIRNLPLVTTGRKVPNIHFVASCVIGRVGDPTRCLSSFRGKVCAEFLTGMLQKRTCFPLLARSAERHDPRMHMLVVGRLGTVREELPVR